MSFRFVGTALTILSTSGASTLYFADGMPATAPHGATVVVPVTQAPAQAPTRTEAQAPDPQIKAVVTAKDVWRPRIWVGSGASLNPITGAPLTREEQESGWVDGPEVFAREIMRTVADPVTGAPKLVREPNPEVLVLKPGEKAPAWVRGSEVALAPGVEIEDAPPPVRMPAPTRTEAPVKTEAAARMESGYRIHLESYHDEHLVASAWTALQKANPTVLGALQPSTSVIEIPKKGKFVRLLAGGFETRQQAEKACAALKKAHRNQYCHPLAAGRETT